MVRYLRMFRAFAASEFQFEMEYRGNFYLSIFEMFLVIGTSIGAVLIMFGHTTTMNGWTLPEMIVLLGVYYLIQAGVNLVFSPSFERLMEHVRVATIVPIGIAVTAPANAIAGRMDAVGVALLGAGTALAVGIASALWRRGLRSYTGASA